MLRFFRPVVAHCPESLEEVRLNARVALNVSRKMNTAMQDIDIVSKHLDNGLALGTVTITNKRPDATVEFENKGEEANKRVSTSVFNNSPGKTMHRI